MRLEEVNAKFSCCSKTLKWKVTNLQPFQIFNQISDQIDLEKKLTFIMSECLHNLGIEKKGRGKRRRPFAKKKKESTY